MKRLFIKFKKKKIKTSIDDKFNNLVESLNNNLEEANTLIRNYKKLIRKPKSIDIKIVALIDYNGLINIKTIKKIPGYVYPVLEYFSIKEFKRKMEEELTVQTLEEINNKKVKK